jgi:hypothetical protein
MLISAPVAIKVAYWGIEGILHCSEAWAKLQRGAPGGGDCRLGFDILFPLAWLITIGGTGLAGLFGVLRMRPLTAHLMFLSVAGVSWLVNVAALFAHWPRPR